MTAAKSDLDEENPSVVFYNHKVALVPYIIILHEYMNG